MADTDAPAGLIDHGLLASLRAALGPGIDMVIRGAVKAIDERLPRLRDLAELPPSDDLARLAHEIGGMAGQVGMHRLSRAALELEQHTRAGDIESVRGSCIEVIDLAPQSLHALRAI